MGKATKSTNIGLGYPFDFTLDSVGVLLRMWSDSQVPRDFETIEFTGAIHDEASLEAIVGSSSVRGIMSVISSELTLSGDAFRPWPVELRIAILPLSK